MTGHSVILSIQITADGFLASVSSPSVLGMAVLAFGVGTGVGLLYRLAMDSAAPWHVPIIVGVGAVGLWMNTASTIVEFMEQTAAQEPLLLRNMATNSVAIVASGFTAIIGARFGNTLAPNVRTLSGATETKTPVNRIVRTVGRFITVTVPTADDIDDIEGYEMVADDTKDAFSGMEFLFPRGLTIEELHRRIVDRLHSDYGVGHVDMELNKEGEITRLAVGSRAAGIGPTLPPRQGAIALEADPAPKASPGDRIHLWMDGDDGAQRVTRAELRAANGDIATVIVDINRINVLNQSETYNIATLHSKTQPELAFASLLRAANVTMASVTITSDSPIAGLPVGGFSLPVLAIRDPDRTIETVPPRERVCRPGSTVYVIGRLDVIRKFRNSASGRHPSEV